MRGSLRSAMRVAVGGLAAVFSMLLLSGLTLRRVILPHIDAWRAQLERHAGRALGFPLSRGDTIAA